MPNLSLMKDRKKPDQQRIMFLVEFMSVILLKQQGLIEEGNKNVLNYFLKSDILMGDIKQDPFLFIKMFTNYVIH